MVKGISGIKFTYENDDGDEIEAVLPARKEVCSRCEGNGTHLHPDIGQHAYSMEEFFEEFDDEGREQYFSRGGMYDVICEECRGKNVVDVVDEEACARDPKLAELLKEYERVQRHDADYESMCRSERAMGA